MKSVNFRKTGAFSFECPVKDWPENGFLQVDLRLTQRSLGRATFRVYRPGEDAHAAQITQKLMPNIRVRAGFAFSCLRSKSHFMMPQPGQYKSGFSGEPCYISEMERMTLEFNPADGLEKIEIFDAFITTEKPEFPVEEKLLVDEMGQIATKDWPGKIHSADELTETLKKRREEAKGVTYPEGYSKWGGWLKKQFDKTGYFHTHYDGRRWWLVDPDGYAFLSNGPCYGNRMGIYSIVTGMEGLCAWLPEKDDPLYKAAYIQAYKDPEFFKRNGPHSPRDMWMFNFSRANMMRAFGDDWWNAWADIHGAQMRAWGMNTLGVGVGNYPDERTYDYIKKVQIPFVLSLINFPKPEKCLFRDFPDVYDPEYKALSEEYAKQLLPYREEPLLIGYFLTNEPEWLFQPVSLTRIMLRENTAPFARKAFIARMKEKYGQIAALNKAWQADFGNFEALDQRVRDDWMMTEEAIADLAAFDEKLTQLYAKIPSDALKRIAPNHLNLGMRYSSFVPRTTAGFEEYDIFSYNCYQVSPIPKADAAYEGTKKPLMVGEWHFCGYDRGLLGSGLVQAHNQEERAKAIQYYTEQAFAHPGMVGIHYFEYFDQPALGRFDGATGQSGLVDVCTLPYPEVDAVLKDVARRVYPIADGQIPPTEEMGRIDPERIY